MCHATAIDCRHAVSAMSDELQSNRFVSLYCDFFKQNVTTAPYIMLLL